MKSQKNDSFHLLEYYLKNFELFKVKPSISTCFSAPAGIPDNELHSLITLLNKWFIQRTFVFNDIKDNEALINFIDDNNNQDLLNDINLYFQFTPDLESCINQNRDQIEQIIQPQIFCTNQYHKSQTTWGKDIFHFHGFEPEIFKIKTSEKLIKIPICYPEDIEVIYAAINPASNQSLNIPLKDITANLNKSAGLLHLREKYSKEITIIVIRKCYFHEKDHLTYNFDYFNFDCLTELQQTFTKTLPQKTDHIKGIFYNLNKMLSFDHEGRFVQASSEFKRLFKKHYKTDLIQNFATFCLLKKETGQRYNVYLNHLFNLYFNSVLISSLSVINNKKVKYFCDINNPLLTAINFYQPAALKIDEDRFGHLTPYSINAVINLKRSANQQYRNNLSEVSVVIHNLLNTRYSFSEKKYHIDYLFIKGANHIYFNIPWFASHSLNQLYSNIDELDPNYQSYSEWFAYIHQLGHFLKSSVHRSELLVFYPSWDASHKCFVEIIEEINKIGIDYELIEFDDFNDNNICFVEQGYINYKNKVFNIIMLPGLSVIPFATIKKLSQFHQSRGIVIALAKLPERTETPAKQKQLDMLKKEIWLEETNLSSTIYKQHESGGLAYFQPHINRLSDIFTDLDPPLRFTIIAKRTGINYILREANDVFYVFLLNTNQNHPIEFEIKTRCLGRPYYWNFALSESQPCAHWYIRDHWLYIKMKLANHQNQLVVIDKKQKIKIWQLIESQLDGCKMIEQDESSFQMEGWQRDEGYFKLLIANGKKQKYLNYKIKTKLPVLAINPKGWYLDSVHYQDKVTLGDQSIPFPYESCTLFYHKLIVLKEEYIKNKKLFLDLGKLKEWCAVYINDQFVEQRLTPPWLFDISGFVKSGENKISIKVVNNLSNKLAHEFNDDTVIYPIQEYGLFGPVRIIPYSLINFKI